MLDKKAREFAWETLKKKVKPVEHLDCFMTLGLFDNTCDGYDRLGINNLANCFRCGWLEFVYHKEFPIVAFHCEAEKKRPCSEEDRMKVDNHSSGPARLEMTPAKRKSEYFKALQDVRKEIRSGTKVSAWLSDAQFKLFRQAFRENDPAKGMKY